MASPAESIIQKIFETAEKDDRIKPVFVPLRDAFARGEWKPGALAAIVEQAILMEAKERE